MTHWLVRRLSSNGRWWVTCARCRNQFWLTPEELFGWSECPHCVGWWTFRLP